MMTMTHITMFSNFKNGKHCDFAENMSAQVLSHLQYSIWSRCTLFDLR